MYLFIMKDGDMYLNASLEDYSTEDFNNNGVEHIVHIEGNVTKLVNQQDQTDINVCEHDEMLLDIEPEECESCRKDAEENGTDYEFNFRIVNRQAICTECGKGM